MSSKPLAEQVAEIRDDYDNCRLAGNPQAERIADTLFRAGNEAARRSYDTGYRRAIRDAADLVWCPEACGECSRCELAGRILGLEPGKKGGA